MLSHNRSAAAAPLSAQAQGRASYCCAVTTVALLRRAMCRKLRSSAHCKDMKHICKEVGRGCTAVCAGAGPPCALQAQNDPCRQTNGGQL